MEIISLGHASFKIKGKTLPAGRQGPTVVTDPYDSAMLGTKFPKIENVDIVTVSHGHPDHNAVANIAGNPFIITGPGEYEVKGVTVLGVRAFHDDQDGAARGKVVMYKITIDDVRVCHLGDLGHKLTDSQLDEIGDVDILLVPVGGFYTIDPTMAAQVVAAIEPLIVIPMHYFKPGMPQEEFGKLATVDKFLKEMGVENLVPQPKLVISKDKLPETTTVIVLE